MVHINEARGNLAHLAALSDSARPEELDFNDGYVVDTKELTPGVVRVWAPCGCVLVANKIGDTLLTVCQTEACNFEWEALVKAIASDTDELEDEGSTLGAEVLSAEPLALSSEENPN